MNSSTEDNSISWDGHDGVVPWEQPLQAPAQQACLELRSGEDIRNGHGTTVIKAYLLHTPPHAILQLRR